MTRTTAIVPMKPLRAAKTRLAPALTPADRERLVNAMLSDVLAALDGAPSIDRVLLVTADATGFDTEGWPKVSILSEPHFDDLNAALSAALRHVDATDCRQALILPGDLPLARPADIEAITADRHCARGGAYIVIAGSHDGDGTNALLLRPPAAMPPAFGPGSFARHQEQARVAGIPHTAISLPSLALDVDTPADLRALTMLPRYAWLRAIRPEGSAGPVETDDQRLTKAPTA